MSLNNGNQTAGNQVVPAPAHPRRRRRTPSEQEQYEKERRDRLERELNIPDFLYRFSSTFYKRVTGNKEQRLKKIFTHKVEIKDKEKLARYISESFLDDKVGNSVRIEDMSQEKESKLQKDKKIDVELDSISISSKKEKGSARSLQKEGCDEKEKEEFLKKMRSESALNKKSMIKSISSGILSKPPVEREKSGKKKKIIKIENEAEEEEDLNCQVCFNNKADSVYMECGHGGVCYDCATSMWKNNEECYLCRSVIFLFISKKLEKNFEKKFKKKILIFIFFRILNM